MADLVYTRVSTDEQSTQRQTHLLAAAGLTADGTDDTGGAAGAGGVRMFCDPATSSKIPALERAGFCELARYARPGDRVTVSELYRLCRDLADILAVREWCWRHDVALRVLSGPLSGIVDLAAADATTTMLVNVLVSVGQFQRDLQNELTRDGLAAARAAGTRSGRRPQVAQLGVLDDVRAAFRAGISVAALARTHHVSRVAIRTAVADLLPGRSDTTITTDRVGDGTAAVDRQTPVRIEVPGKIAHRLQTIDGLDQAARHAVAHGKSVRRGQGYNLHITATAAIHEALLRAVDDLAVDDLARQTPADRKAMRIYRDRLTTAGIPASSTRTEVRA